MPTIAILIFLSFCSVGHSYYSINYKPGQNDLESVKMNFGVTVTTAPSSEQVADIYLRLSGMTPLFWEGLIPKFKKFQHNLIL
jgi:hypothetical protein